MTSIPKINALFESSLASSLSAAGSSMTLSSATDRDGNALSGLYGFIVDEGTADEEFVVGTVSGTTVTITARGLDADSPTTEVAGNKKAHRRGATVKITDYPIMGYLRGLANGDYTFPNKLSYESHPTFSSNTEIVDKKYVDDTVTSGAPDASTTVKGLVEIATDAELQAGTGTGGTSAVIVAAGDSFTETPTANKVPVANSSGKLAAGWGGAASTLATLNGSSKVVEDPANATSTPTASKIPIADGSGDLDVGWIPHGTTADKIVKLDGSAKLPAVDGSALTNVIKITSGVTSKNLTTTGAQTIAHGLSATPKYIKISAHYTDNTAQSISLGTYNGTSTNSTYSFQTGSVSATGTDTSNVVRLYSGGTANYAYATAAVDGTNITLTWSKNNSPTGTAYLIWEAIYFG